MKKIIFIIMMIVLSYNVLGIESIEQNNKVYTDFSMDNGKGNIVINPAGYYKEDGIIKQRSDVSNLLIAERISGQIAYNCNINEDENTGVKCNSINITKGKWLVDLEVNPKEIGYYPVKIESYNYILKKIEIKEVDSINFVSLQSKFRINIELETQFDKIHIGEHSTVINLHANTTGGGFKDNYMDTRQDGTNDYENNGGRAWMDLSNTAYGILQANITRWIGTGQTIEGVRFNGYNVDVLDRAIYVFTVNEDWLEGTGTGAIGNSSFRYNNNSVSLEVNGSYSSWNGGNRTGQNSLIGNCNFGSGAGWATCNLTNMTAIKDGYDDFGWINLILYPHAGKLWYPRTQEDATPWTMNISYYESVGDETPPDINITSPTNTTYITNQTILNITVSEQTNCSYSLNRAINVSLGNSSSSYQEVVNSSEGGNYLSVGCLDTASNYNTTSISYYVNDTTSPIITINLPSNTTYINNQTILNITVNEETNCSYSLNGAVNVSLGVSNTTYQTTITSLFGVNYINIGCFDTALNYDTDSISYYVNSTPVCTEIPNITWVENYNRSINLSLYCSDVDSETLIYHFTNLTNINVTVVNNIMTFFPDLNYTTTGDAYNFNYTDSYTTNQTTNTFYLIITATPIVTVIDNTFEAIMSYRDMFLLLIALAIYFVMLVFAEKFRGFYYMATVLIGFGVYFLLARSFDKFISLPFLFWNLLLFIRMIIKNGDEK